MTLMIVALAFAAGTLLALGLSAGGRADTGFAARIQRLAQPAPAPAGADRSVNSRPPKQAAVTALQRIAGPRPVPAGFTTQIERAGRPGGLDAAAFVGLRWVSAAAFLALAPLAAHWLGRGAAEKAAVAVLDLVIGLILPDAWLQGVISTRQGQIRNALPDTLDLIVVSMEAGIGFDAAVANAADAMRGPLADEMRRLLQEMRLGRTRAEALRDLAARTGVAEINSFVSAVIQADRLGTGLANVLRLQSESARSARMQRIRAEAARLPTKMLFPLVFFLMPALFVVLLGPGMINLLNALAR